MKGYVGRILRANLSNGSSRTNKLLAEWSRKLLGGMGFASMLLFNETPKEGLNAIGGDNELIVAPGLLTGTCIPKASETIFIAKSPLTHGFGKASAGAPIGPALEKAGYDLLVIEGQSPKPVLLRISDNTGKVEHACSSGSVGQRRPRNR